MMKELELKYGCNPNQKPSRIYMTEGELPVTVLNGKPGYINFMDAFNSWQLVKELKARHRSACRRILQACVSGRRRCGTASDRHGQSRFTLSIPMPRLSPIACRLHPCPWCGPAVLLRRLGCPVRRLRRRHRHAT